MSTIANHGLELIPDTEDEVIINAVVVTDSNNNSTVESVWMTLGEAVDHGKKILADMAKSGNTVKVVSSSNRTNVLEKSLGLTDEDAKVID